MADELSKAEFKEEFKYSESTYQRQMKEFKSSPFSEGYKAVTGKEIIIDADLFREFRRWKADNNFRIGTRKETTA